MSVLGPEPDVGAAHPLACAICASALDIRQKLLRESAQRKCCTISGGEDGRPSRESEFRSDYQVLSTGLADTRNDRVSSPRPCKSPARDDIGLRSQTLVLHCR